MNQERKRERREKEEEGVGTGTGGKRERKREGVGGFNLFPSFIYSLIYEHQVFMEATCKGSPPKQPGRNTAEAERSRDRRNGTPMNTKRARLKRI